MAFDKKKYDKEYAKTHREKMNAAVKKWRETHPDEWKKRNAANFRRWTEKNREKYNAYQRDYKAKQKEVDEKP